MAVTGKISLDSKLYEQTLQSITVKTERAAQEVVSAADKSALKVTSDIEKINRTVAKIPAGSMASKMQKAFTSIKSGIAGIVAAIAGNALLGSMKSLVAQCDNLSKSARNIGITGEELQGLEYAANSANMGLEKIPMAFSKIKDAAGKALSGDADAIRKFAQLGISVDELRGKKPYELFSMVADAVNMIQDPVERSRAGIALFGEEFDKMQVFLAGYADSAEKARESGMIIEEDQLKAAEELNQAITNLTTALTALAANSGILSFFKGLAEHIANLSKEIKNIPKIREMEKRGQVKKSLAGKMGMGWLDSYVDATGTAGVFSAPGLGMAAKALKKTGIAGSQVEHADYISDQDMAAAREKRNRKMQNQELSKEREEKRKAEAERKDEERRKAEAAKAEAEEQKAEQKKQEYLEEEKFQAEYQDKINKGLGDEADALRLNNELKKAGIKLSEEEMKTILAYRKAQREQRLDNVLKNKAEDLKDKALRESGHSREAEYDKAMRDAEKTKGSALTKEEKARVAALADLSWEWENRQRAPELGNLSIQTNSLTSRGGFASGAVMPDKDAVNRSIAEYNRKTNELLEKINRNLEGIGTF